jgi:hypothetical protein
MKPSSLPPLTGRTSFSRDRIGILLLLIIGMAGQLIVFLIPDPLDILAPQIPMLTPRDWQGSYIGTELFFTDSWRASYSADTPWSPFIWDEKRGFYQSLYLTGDGFLSSVDQTLVWYADPIENANVWKKELDAGTYNSWPILESRLGSDKPTSFLACLPDPGLMTSPPQCWYLAYREHWFTAIFFYRQSNGEVLTEDLLLQDIQQLTARVDQLLMSAPDEPCFGFLCTNRNIVQK